MQTRVEQQTASIRLFDRDVTIYLVEQAEQDQNSKYAFAFAQQLYVLTKENIDDLCEASKYIAYSEQRMLETLSNFNINEPGLISSELKKTLLNQVVEKIDNLMAFRFDNTVYFSTIENLPTLVKALEILYMPGKDNQKTKIFLTENSVYPPLSTENTSEGELLVKLFTGDIMQAESTGNQQSTVQQNSTENMQKIATTKRPTIHGLMFFETPVGESSSSSNKPQLSMYPFPR